MTTMSGSKKRKAVGNGMDDKISGLPRNLIDSILERMPIRDAGRTSILSRKWRYIWSAITSLVFDKQFFAEVMRNTPGCADKFVRVISEILLLHNGPILKFVLYIPCLPYDWEAHITRWLLFLSRNGVKELNLDNRMRRFHKQLCSVFSCSELTHLKFCNYMFKPPPAYDYSYSFQFRNLIYLHFDNIFFYPISVCAPLLESLYFTGCTGIERFSISAPKLKTYVTTGSSNVQLISFRSHPNLTTLSIALRKRTENLGQSRKINLRRLIGSSAKISKLSFDGFVVKLLDAGRLYTTFSHLEHLVLREIRFDDQDQISCMFSLLKGSPNLRKLDVKASAVEDIAMDPDLSCLEAPDCMNQMFNQLQTVEIRLMHGLRAELLLIEYILACSPLLEEILVQYRETVGAREGFRISTKLRASPKAKIVYEETN